MYNMKIIFPIFTISILVLMSCQPKSTNESGETTPATTAQPLQQNSGAEIENIRWKLIEVNGQPVTNPPANQKEAFIQLQSSDKRLTGNGSCNTLVGAYELSDGNGIKFSKVASTMMGCPDMTLERELGSKLESMDNYSINGNQMTLQKAKMAPTFRFEAQPQ